MGTTLIHHIGSHSGGDNGTLDEGMCLCHQILKWFMSFQVCTQGGRKISPNTNEYSQMIALISTLRDCAL